MTYEYYKSQIEKELDKIEFVKDVEKKTKIPKFFLFVAVSAVLFFFVVLNLGGSLITNIVGFLYPAYASFKAIESDEKDDDKLWLTYWVVYAFFNVVEYFTDWLLFWLPFYFLIKLIFLVYLFSPRTKGAVYLYDKFIRQFIKKHEEEIDKKTKELFDKTMKTATAVANDAMDNPTIQKNVKIASAAATMAGLDS